MNIQKVLPACAVAMGVALVLVTSAFKEAPKNKSGDQLYTFQYNPPPSDPYSVAHVEDVANWSYTADTDPCSNDNIEACKVQVPVGYVNNPMGSPTLKASANIVATESSTDIAYVASTAAGSNGTISNRLE